MQLTPFFLTLLAISVVPGGSYGLPSNKPPSVASAWYAGWHADDFPLSRVSFSKYTQLTYAFATTTSDPSTLGLQDADRELLPQFVSLTHKQGIKALLSIGGWIGSLFFSSNVGTPANRKAFVGAVVDLVEQYNLDGIEFDWEYPGKQGIGCNVVSPADTENFLAFLQELRGTEVGANLILSAATGILPFTDAQGNPSSDVSEFSRVLDYITIMNYDLWDGSSQVVGPNAPLFDSCADPAYRIGSVASAMTAWNLAGMPIQNMVLGVPAYGQSYRVPLANAFEDASNQTLALYPTFDPNSHPAGDSWDDPAGVDECGNNQPAGGVWDFWGLIGAGYLTKNGDPSSAVSYRFDNCSRTPFIYSETNQIMISYDDAQSFAFKGGFINDNGLRGFAMWEAGGDLNDILLDSINAAVAGLQPGT